MLKNEVNENIILVNEIALLKSTKSIIEKKILDIKNSFANKFFSFFSSNNDNSKSLTEEEKASIENYLKHENLVKYLKGELFSDIKTVNQNIIVKKYKKYFDYLIGRFDINNFEIKFASKLELKNKDLYLKGVRFDFEYGNNNLKFELNILDNNKDIIHSINNEENKKEIINKKEEEVAKNIISCSYDNNSKIKIFIEKENFELSENNLFLIICYSKFILDKLELNNRIYNYNIGKIKEQENNEIKYENIINNIYFPFFPSVSLKTNNENKIDIKISNYSYTEKLVSFDIEINDSNNPIMDKYHFEINLNNNGIDINLEKPLSFNINKSIIEEFVNNFKNINNDMNILTKSNHEILFNFNFSKYSNNIKLLLNKNFNIFIKEFNFIIKDDDYQSSIKFKNAKFLFENKSFSITSDDIIIELDILSFSQIINDIKHINYKSEQITKYEYNMKEIGKSFKMNINNISIYMYLSHKSSYIFAVINNISSENEPQKIHITNNSINGILAKYIDKNNPNDAILLDSKKINFNMRIFSFSNYSYKLDIDSPIIGLSIIICNCNELQKLYELISEDDDIF